MPGSNAGMGWCHVRLAQSVACKTANLFPIKEVSSGGVPQKENIFRDPVSVHDWREDMRCLNGYPPEWRSMHI